VSGKKNKSALTTEVKAGLNSLLRPVGLRLETTRAETREVERLKRLSDRGYWSVPRYVHGLNFEPARYQKFLSKVCSVYQPNFPEEPPNSQADTSGFYLQNGWFGPVDAEILYSFVRHFKPARILEIGSGFSTRVVHRAILDGSLKTKLTCIDPMPRASVLSYADEYVESVVENVPASNLVNGLGAHDILFIDSSHVIKTGGDITFLFLEIMPQLKPGVIIHIHDIFLPFEYPKHFVDMRIGWTEQYLLHGFLAYNRNYEILWPAYYMWQENREAVLDSIPVRDVKRDPSSFWIKKNEN